MGKGLSAIEARSLFAVAALILFLAIRAGAEDKVTVGTIVTMVSCDTRDFIEEDLEAIRFRKLTSRGFVYDGSPLNNGRENVTSSDRECLSLCAQTPGCRAWTRDAQLIPKGACWLHAALPKPRIVAQQNSGRVQLKDVSLASCGGIKSVEFKGVVSYTVLSTVSAEECCARCEEDSKLCHGWEFRKSTRECRLFGNEVPASAETICTSCTSGRRVIVKGGDDDKECKDSEIQIGRAFNGFSRLTQPEAFLTKTSKECCTLCKNIRECRSWTWRAEDKDCRMNADVPNSSKSLVTTHGGVQTSKSCGGPSASEKQCRFEEGIETFQGDPFEQNPWIPDGKHLKIPTPEGCCAVCEGIPECTTWTFTRGKEGQKPYGCWIKFKVPGALNIRAERVFNQSITGVVPSRLSPTELKDFKKAVEEARKGAPKPPKPTDPEEKRGSRGLKRWVIGAVVVSVVGFLVVLLLCIVAYTCHNYKKKKKREEEARRQNMQMAIGWPRFIETIPAGDAGGGRPSAIQPYVPPEATSIAVNNATHSPYAPSVGGAPLVQQISLASQSVGGTSSRGQCSPVILGEDRLSARMPESIAEEEEEGAESMHSAKVELLTGLKGRGGKGGAYFGREQEQGLFCGEGIDTALIDLAIGDRLGGKYVFEGEIRAGKTSVVVDARQRIGQATPVIINFFRSRTAFEMEVEFFSQKIVSPRIPQVLDIFPKEEVQLWGLPPTPCVVLERGDFTLAEFLESRVTALAPLDQGSILYKISLAVDVLHQHGIAHRNLKPENVVMFSSSLSWKLIDYSFSSRKGTTSPIIYSSIRYCSPEMLTADAKECTHIFAKLSVDMWSLGLMFWEVLTGFPLFGRQFTEEEVMSMLLGVTPLPFEKDPDIWQLIENRAARRIVQNLLLRSPNARWPIQKVLSNSFFSSGADTVQEEQSVAQSNVKLKGIVESVHTVEEKLDKMVELAIEEIKHNVGAVIIMCCSFFEISPGEFLSKTPTEKELIDGYKKGTLDVKEALTAVNFNPFKQYEKEPRPLLRLERKHMVRVTLLHGASAAMELPISEILSCRIEPTDAPTDTQQVQISPVLQVGHILDAVGYWDTSSHKDSSLKGVGDRSIDLVLDVRIKATGDVLEIRKTIDIQMRKSDDQFKSVIRFNHGKQWFEHLPSWAKIYIHGVVVVWRMIR